ncbi:MAG: TolC family protein [Desulfobulbus sp.]|jgi:outer membrane protein TolC|nr:TolC family protein [Desulfobulbus sp.]
MPAPRILFFLFFLLVCHIEFLQAGQGQAPEDLEALIAQAVTNNPEVKASAERWQMSVERARQAGALEDPMMMFRVQNALIRDPLNFQRDTMTAKVIGLSQKLPFYGKRDLMREEAGFEADAERWVVDERRIELRRMVKETWYQIYLVDRSLETVAGTARLLDDLIRLAESMYGVGKAGQQEIFQAQVERSKMEEMRIGLEQKRRTLVATLNTLAYRPPETAIPQIAKTSLPPFSFSATELESLALAHRPALKSLKAKIDKAEAGARLAEKELYPDFTVSLEYMQREPAMDTPGDDMYGAQLSFNLPIQSDRRHAKVAEMQASKRMAVQELAVLQNQIRLAINDGLAQLERSRKLTRLYDKGILLQAGGAIESAMAAYRTDKAKFSEVLASRMALFNFEREYHGAMADHQMQLAVLENVVGTPLPPAP